jgi:hypothetical protein
MRFAALAVATSLCLAEAVGLHAAPADDARDYVFTYADDHLILRFAGAQSHGMSDRQREEVSDSHVSIMVHDRLAADDRFEAEAVDSAWAEPMQAQLEKWLSTTPGMSAVSAACRSASCRLAFTHAGGRSLSEHEALMAGVQTALDSFLAANPGSFEPVFLIAGHYKEPEHPWIKAYLTRATPQNAAAKPVSTSSH